MTSGRAVREDTRAFEAVVAQQGTTVALAGAENAERVSVVLVSPGWAEELGIRPVAGRVFTAAEEDQGQASGVVVIAHGLWHRRFGGDAAVIGLATQLGDRTVTIVGVFGPGFQFPYDADVWVPHRFGPDEGRLYILRRLRPGATAGKARDELQSVATRLAGTYPHTNRNVGLTATPARDAMAEGQRGDERRLAVCAAGRRRAAAARRRRERGEPDAHALPSPRA